MNALVIRGYMSRLKKILALVLPLWRKGSMFLDTSLILRTTMVDYIIVSIVSRQELVQLK